MACLNGEWDTVRHLWFDKVEIKCMDPQWNVLTPPPKTKKWAEKSSLKYFSVMFPCLCVQVGG